MKSLARFQLGFSVVAFTIAVYLTFRIHSFFIWPVGIAVGFDERYLAPFGLRMLAGDSLPYVDAISHRGPLLYWVVELFQRHLGPFDWASLRWLSFAFHALTMASCLAIGLVVKRPLAGVFAAIFHAYITAIAFDIGSGIGVNGELVAAPFVLLAFLSLAFGLLRARSKHHGRFLLLSGVMAGLASLAKQTSLVIILPLVVWATIHRLESKRPPHRALLFLIGGFLAPFVAVIGIYAYKGALGSLAYWFYSYNADIYMEPYAKGSDFSFILSWLEGRPLLAVALALPIIVGAVLPFTKARSLRPSELLSGYLAVGAEATLACLTALSLFAALLPLRFWPHYFIGAIPLIGLLVGSLLDNLLGPRSRSSSVVARALLLSAILFGFFQTHQLRLASLSVERSEGRHISKRWNPACRAVEQYSQKREPIFIWGFDGDFYIDCRRLPASRFVFTTFIAGVVPPFWRDARPSRVVPGSRERLEADLRSSRPPLILDFHERLGDGLRIVDIPQLGRLLREDYCQVEEIQALGRKAAVWVHRDQGFCSRS